MTDIILGIGVATFIVYTGFQISYILSLRRTSQRMADFLQNTEGNLNSALFELRDTLENLKKITGNVNAVSEDVRQISRTVASVEPPHGLPCCSAQEIPDRQLERPVAPVVEVDRLDDLVYVGCPELAADEE